MPAIAEAVAALNPQPRGNRWTSLSYCVLDAVWSINTRYDTVVVPLVQRVAATFGDAQPATRTPQNDPVPLSKLVAHYGDTDALKKDTNAQLTSPRGGILRAEAALRYAQILAKHGIDDLGAAGALLAGPDPTWKAVNDALSVVPGDGMNSIRRGYLWMLSGNDNGIKPDRLVLRWLARHGLDVDPAEARRLLTEVANELTQTPGPGPSHRGWSTTPSGWTSAPASRGALQRHTDRRINRHGGTSMTYH